VEKGQPLFELYADDEVHLEAGRHAIEGALVLGDGPYVSLEENGALIRE
jgi:hypothetical protein